MANSVLTHSVAKVENESRANVYPLTPSSGTRGTDDPQSRYRFVIFVDFCLVWISGGLAYLLATSITLPGGRKPYQHGLWLTELGGFLLLMSALIVLFGNMRGLYRFPWQRKMQEELRLLTVSIISAGIFAGSLVYIWRIRVVSIEIVAGTILLTWILLASWREFILSQSIAGLTEKRNVLIAGAGRSARLLRAHLEQNPNLGYVVKGFLDRRDKPRPGDKSGAAAADGVLGTISDLATITRTHFIDEIFINVPSDRHLVEKVTQHARAAGLTVRVVPDLCDGLVVGLPVEYVGELPVMTLRDSPARVLQLILKRAVDTVVSAFVLIALLPFLPVVAAIVKLDSKGRVFYKSVRVGKKGKAFICYKVRTMVENADTLKESLQHLNERDGIFFKINRDPRITRAGRLLRKFSIDEFPQLWNVLKGDMSLVGPRPCLPDEYNQYALEHLRRLDVAPGITGLWQVKARRSPSFESYVQLDKKYVDDWSFWLDFKILWMTVGVVLAGTGG